MTKPDLRLHELQSHLALRFDSRTVVAAPCGVFDPAVRGPCPRPAAGSTALCAMHRRLLRPAFALNRRGQPVLPVALPIESPDDAERSRRTSES